jgi:hypothetical protein
MLTAACLGLPGSVLFLRWVYQQRRLTGRELAAASPLGAASPPPVERRAG